MTDRPGRALLAQVGMQPPALSQRISSLGRLQNAAAADGKPGRLHAAQPPAITFDEPPRTLPALEVRSSPGRGLGLFAQNAIPTFTCILADDALLSLAEGEDLPELWTRYLLLPDDLRRSYDELNITPRWVDTEPALRDKLAQRGYDSDIVQPMARTASIFHSNAFNAKGSPSHPIPSSDPSRWAYALFPTVARINHSCTPNAFAHYRPRSGQMSVYALRDIAAGDELEISYVNMAMTRAERRSATLGWSFTCVCPACEGRASLGTRRYERVLELVNESRIPVPRGATESRSESASLRDYMERTRAAIDAAERGEFPWLRAALPLLYVRLAHCWRAIATPGATETAHQEADTAEAAAWLWRHRIAGARLKPDQSSSRWLDVQTGQ